VGSIEITVCDVSNQLVILLSKYEAWIMWVHIPNWWVCDNILV